MSRDLILGSHVCIWHGFDYNGTYISNIMAVLNTPYEMARLINTHFEWESSPLSHSLQTQKGPISLDFILTDPGKKQQSCPPPPRGENLKTQKMIFFQHFTRNRSSIIGVGDTKWESVASPLLEIGSDPPPPFFFKGWKVVFCHFKLDITSWL